MLLLAAMLCPSVEFTWVWIRFPEISTLNYMQYNFDPNVIEHITKFMIGVSNCKTLNASPRSCKQTCSDAKQIKAAENVSFECVPNANMAWI